MQTIYRLTSAEIEQVKFEAHLISDRQNTKDSPEAIAEQLSYVVGRFDMFWIECKLGDTDLGPLSITPNRQNPDRFYVDQNHCKVSGGELKERADRWFRQQPEFQQQKQWVQQIIDTHYTPHGDYLAYCEWAKEQHKAWHEAKIAAAKANAEDLDQLIKFHDAGHHCAERKDLEDKLNSALAPVYRKTDGFISTLAHLVYIYKTYVLENDVV